MGNEKPQFVISRKVVSDGYAKFDAGSRAEFLAIIEGGVKSKIEAMRVLKLNPSTVNRWIFLGKATRDEWASLTGHDPWLNESDEYDEHRNFYLDLRSAETKRDARVELVLASNAMSDWRAADALGKRQERMALLEDTKRLKKAQADAAVHEARFARARADAAEKGEAIISSVVFPPQLIEKLPAALRESLEVEMKRLGYTSATDAELAKAAASIDDEMLDEIESMGQRWDDKDKPSLN